VNYGNIIGDIMTKITSEDIVGAVVEEVESEGECIECIRLCLPDGRSVDVVVNGEARSYDMWMEVKDEE